MISTHPYFFWMVCHLSRTFSLKEPEHEPQNGLSLLPIARPYPFLPLTHDPPLLYWLGTGWWCLGFVRAPLHARLKLVRCSYVCHGLEARQCILLLILNLLWHELFSDFSFLMACLSQGMDFVWLWDFLSSAYSFAPSVVLLPFLSCFFTIPVVVLFDPSLLGLFKPTACSSLNWL